MTGRLQGKTALITGAASGFGRGIATKFAAEGANVIIADLATEQGEAVAGELGGIFTRADITDSNAWTSLLQLALDKFGRLDIIVNNAGATYANKPTEEVTDKDFDLVMNVNVKSIYLCAAVVNATKTMAVEYGPHQIRFNSVSPVVGSTGMTHLFIGMPDTEENRKGFVSAIPMGRPSTPADVANACCYLASDEAGFITGVNFEVDGGRCV